MLSIVIPIHNEEGALLTLHSRLTSVLSSLRESYEIIFVDDASTDGSVNMISRLVDTDPTVKLIQLRRNFGQTAALAAGFREASGDVIISMDGDLQHDPADIPSLLAKIDEGYDIASGWREHRVDPFIRKFPSRIANWLMAQASGIPLHDFGTTFKAYRAATLKQVNLYGELHRFIPALAGLYGARVAEVPIRSLPRTSGRSHYGLGRTVNVFLDLLTIRFLTRYFTRPMHFFGRIGLMAFAIAGAMTAFLAIEKLWGRGVLAVHGPILVLAVCLALSGIMMLSAGLLSEILIRTYFESQNKPIYAVRRILSGSSTPIGEISPNGTMKLRRNIGGSPAA